MHRSVPLTANVTNTVALVLTGAGSTIGSRPELAGQGPRVRRFGLVTALGGATGAAILLLSPARDFELVVPVLIAGAAVLLLIQPRVKSLSARPGGEHSVALNVALFAGAVYQTYGGLIAGGQFEPPGFAATLGQQDARRRRCMRTEPDHRS